MNHQKELIRGLWVSPETEAKALSAGSGCSRAPRAREILDRRRSCKLHTQRSQHPFIKEYTLNHKKRPL